MTVKYGKNYNLQFVNVPALKIPRGEQYAGVTVAYDQFDIAVDGGGLALATGDVIKLMKLPQGARVLDCLMISPDVGGTSLIQLGFEANGVDSAVVDAFILSKDISGQAVFTRGDNPVGIARQFSVETQVSALITNNGAAVTGILKFEITYVVD